MIAINYSTLRQNMKKYFDSVSDDYETMVITRKENKNVCPFENLYLVKVL